MNVGTHHTPGSQGRGKPSAPSASVAPFQERTGAWIAACFGEAVTRNVQERCDRFMEEAIELVQACGATREDVLQLVGYVFDRPVGEPAQEVGGVMITLAGLCNAKAIDMQAAGETELQRNWSKADAIRAKWLTKPKQGPLPAWPANASAATAADAEPDLAINATGRLATPRRHGLSRNQQAVLQMACTHGHLTQMCGTARELAGRQATVQSLRRLGLLDAMEQATPKGLYLYAALGSRTQTTPPGPVPRARTTPVLPKAKMGKTVKMQLTPRSKAP